MTRALLALLLAGCCHEQVMPPTSLACRLTVAPPPWYHVEASGLPACLVVVGVPIPLGPCCPEQTVCLTIQGGRALIVNHSVHPSWEAEAWARCGPVPHGRTDP